MKKYVIPAKVTRRFPDPIWAGPSQKIDHLLLVVRAKDLPELPTTPNPRSQKTSKPIYKEVAKSLLDQTDPSFHLKNKGITVVAQDAKYDEDAQAVEVFFGEGHGIVDGAHTYAIIRENREECPENQFVKMEILIGVPEEMVEPIAGGLNTSVQVSEMSLANLSKRFEWIKEELKGTRYASQIAYRENESGEFDIRDIVGIMTLFNVGEFKDGVTHPVIAYRNKALCLELFEREEKTKGEASAYRKLRPLLRDVLALYDHIQIRGRELYNKAGGKGGGLSWVEHRKRGEYTLTFSGQKTDAKLVEGALYPMLGAFRYLVEDKDGCYQWKVGTFARVKELFDRVGAQMMQATQETSKNSGRNPSIIGKSIGHWDNLYKTVALAYLEHYKS